MFLSQRQRDDLHKSMLEYLKSQKLNSTYKVMCKELAVEPEQATNDTKYAGLLEKKWLSVIRLQKKIMDLEQSLAELRETVPSYLSQTNGKVDLATWIPRAPARHVLSGHRQPITSLSFHPTFNVIATCSEDATIKLWDWETGEFEKTLKSHTKAVTDLDYSSAQIRSNGKTSNHTTSVLLASCSNDLTIKLWDSENEYACVKTLHGHDHVVSSVRFLPNVSENLVSVSRDCSIKIWDINTGYCLRTIENAHEIWIRCLSPSYDGETVLTGGSDQVARIYGVEKSECKIEFRGHEHVIECAIFAPPSAIEHLCKISGTKVDKGLGFVVTGSRDKTIKIWASGNGSCIATLIGHDNWIRALVFHPDGKYLLSASDDKCIKVWDLEQGGRCCRTIEDAHGHFIGCLRWGLNQTQRDAQNGQATRDTESLAQGRGRYVLASGGVDQVVKIWMP